MTSKVFNAFWPFIVTIVSGYLLYLFTQDKVELQYFLTEPIPLLLSDGEVLESVQQLTILNSGEVTIDSLGIKIRGEIKEAKLIKNFADDKVSQNISNTFIQAKYYKLLPNSKFSYILKSSVGRISSSQIDISYSKGKAINGFEPQDNSNVVGIIYVLFLISFLAYSLISFLKSRKINSLTLSSYEKILTVLNEPKPFYINKNEWDTVRINYIESKRDIESFYSSNLQDEQSYKILNSKKTDNISDFEWSKLIETMTKHFEDLFYYKVKVSRGSEDLKELMSLEKPLNFSNSNWNPLIKKACEELFTINNLDRFDRSLYADSVVKEINKNKPEGMCDEDWVDYSNALKNKYFICVLIELSTQLYASLNNEENLNLELLSERQKEKINSFIYKLKLERFRNITSVYDAKNFLESTDNNWLNETDRSKLEEVANSYIDLEKNTNKYKLLLSNMELIVNKMKLGDKPEELDIEIWNMFKKVEHEVINLSEQNQKDKLLIKSEKSEVSEVKNRVVRQLSIISNVINNPETILEIEDYDNPFAEGNFNNLKKVAELLGRE